MLSAISASGMEHVHGSTQIGKDYSNTTVYDFHSSPLQPNKTVDGYADDQEDLVIWFWLVFTANSGCLQTLTFIYRIGSNFSCIQL